ncbi:polyprotein [Sclerotinia sclerotiorum hypovirus 6]|uniref:Polyprotein n=1 Tax=Sclerotinia sclerotiorum hypovirus 6 TaxID=2490812 RepID=A0ABM7BTJ6_9VIRU|nr:polyprotein [Sclerotinia sclerotiorum hypovirus 6]AZF86111.1 polyprotein [Sclerotinia sclerotiorum hypovirus 6]
MNVENTHTPPGDERNVGGHGATGLAPSQGEPYPTRNGIYYFSFDDEKGVGKKLKVEVRDGDIVWETQAQRQKALDLLWAGGSVAQYNAMTRSLVRPRGILRPDVCGYSEHVDRPIRGTVVAKDREDQPSLEMRTWYARIKRADGLVRNLGRAEDRARRQSRAADRAEARKAVEEKLARVREERKREASIRGQSVAALAKKLDEFRGVVHPRLTLARKMAEQARLAAKRTRIAQSYAAFKERRAALERERAELAIRHAEEWKREGRAAYLEHLAAFGRKRYTRGTSIWKARAREAVKDVKHAARSTLVASFANSFAVLGSLASEEPAATAVAHAFGDGEDCSLVTADPAYSRSVVLDAYGTLVSGIYEAAKQEAREAVKENALYALAGAWSQRLPGQADRFELTAADPALAEIAGPNVPRLHGYEFAAIMRTPDELPGPWTLSTCPIGIRRKWFDSRFAGIGLKQWFGRHVEWRVKAWETSGDELIPALDAVWGPVTERDPEVIKADLVDAVRQAGLSGAKAFAWLAAQPAHRFATLTQRVCDVLADAWEALPEVPIQALRTVADLIAEFKLLTRKRPKPTWAPLIPVSGQEGRRRYAHRFQRLPTTGDLALGPRNYETIVEWYKVQMEAAVSAGCVPIPINEDFVTQINRSPYVDYHLEELKGHALFQDRHLTWTDRSIEADRAALAEVTGRYFVRNEHKLPERKIAEFVKAKYWQHPELYAHADIASPGEILHRLNKKSSPGWPFMDKAFSKRKLIRNGQWDTIMFLADRALASDEHIRDVFQVKPKSLVSSKLRTISASGLVGLVNSERFSISTKKRHDPYGAEGVAGLPLNGWGLNFLYKRAANRQYHVKLDARAYDSTASAVLDVPRRLRKLGFDWHPDREAIHRLIDAVYDSLEDTYLVDVIDDGSGKPAVYEKNTGIATGHGSVTFDNSESEPASWIIPLSIKSGWSIEYIMTNFDEENMGDDNWKHHDIPEGTVTPTGWVFSWDNLCVAIEEMTGIHYIVEGKNTSVAGIDFLSKIGLEWTDAKRAECLAAGVNPDDFLFAVHHNMQSWRARYVGLKQDGFHVAQYRRPTDRCAAQLQKIKGMASLLAHEREMYDFLVEDREYYLNKLERYNPAAARQLRGRKDLLMPSYNRVIREWYSEPKKDARRHNQTRRQARLDAINWNFYAADRALRRARHAVGRIDPERYDVPDPIHEILPPDAFDPTGEVETFAYYAWINETWKTSDPDFLPRPTLSELTVVLRESPFFGQTSATWFMTYVEPRLHAELLAHPEPKTRVRHLAGKHRMRMALGSAIYTALTIGFYNTPAGMLSFAPILFDIYRNGVRRLFSYLSYAYWLDQGRASIEISNMVPKDLYAPFKAWALKFLHMIPQSTPMPDYQRVPGLKNLSLAPVYEAIATAVNLGQGIAIPRRDGESSGFNEREQTVDPWVAVTQQVLEKLYAQKGQLAVALSSPTGTGKTTRFSRQLLQGVHWIPGSIMPVSFQRVIILVPTRTLVAETRIVVNGVDIVKRVTRQDEAFRIPAGVVVMTYGLYRAHFAQAQRYSVGSIVLLDEFALGEPDMLWVSESLRRVGIPRVVMSATPDFSFTTERFEMVRSRIPPRFNVTKVEVADSNCLDIAVGLLCSRVARDAGVCEKILIVHPSIAEGEYIRNSLLHLLPRIQILHPAFKVGLMNSKARAVPDTQVIVASSIARIGLTIPGVTCVIDSDLVRGQHWGTLATVDQDVDASIQLAGRTGRTCDGWYFRCSQKAFGPRMVQTPSALDYLEHRELYDSTATWKPVCAFIPWTRQDGFRALRHPYLAVDEAAVAPEHDEQLGWFLSLVCQQPNNVGWDERLRVASDQWALAQCNAPAEEVQHLAKLRDRLTASASVLEQYVAKGLIVMRHADGQVFRGLPWFYEGAIRESCEVKPMPRNQYQRGFTDHIPALEKAIRSARVPVAVAPQAESPVPSRNPTETANGRLLAAQLYPPIGVKLPRTTEEEAEEDAVRRALALKFAPKSQRALVVAKKSASFAYNLLFHADLSPVRKALSGGARGK